MKIVLALAPVWESLTPPLSLAFLKSSLAQAGYESKCIDFSIQFRPIMVSALGDVAAEEFIAQHPQLWKTWVKQICDEKPDIVGFSLLVSNHANTALIAQGVKEQLPHVKIIAGGPSLTRENDDMLEQTAQFADYIVEGEGENVLVDVVRCIEQKGDMTKVKQLWLKNPDGTVFFTGRGVEQNIDQIAMPDFSDFESSFYSNPGMLPILFSRGCILNCNYCENKWNHLTQRSRSGRNVFEELKRNVKEYGIKEYMFNDDSLISYKTFKQLDEYCDLAIAEGLVMPWSVYGTRVERMLTEDYVRKLRRSGMQRVALGVETFSSKIQHAMGKSSKYDDADKTCRLFAGQGVKTESWIIYGYPTETDADFNDTLQWFVKNPNVLSRVTVNSFGPNAKYQHDKPGVVKYLSGRQWDWVGPESTIEKRKERFLLLIEVLEDIRKARKGDFAFHFGDPLYVKYFSAWGKKEKAYLLERWDELQGIERPKSPFRVFLNKLGVGQTGKREISAYHNYAVRKQTERFSPTLIIDAPADELRRRLFEKIRNHYLQAAQADLVSVEEKMKNTARCIDEIRQKLAGDVSDDVIYAISMKGDMKQMLDDIDNCPVEELSQRVRKVAGEIKTERSEKKKATA